MLPTMDFHEELVNLESVTAAAVLSFESSSLYNSEFSTPQTDRFTADSSASFSQEVLGISAAEIQSVVQPDGVENNVEWEPVASVCVHHQIVRQRD